MGAARRGVDACKRSAVMSACTQHAVVGAVVGAVVSTDLVAKRRERRRCLLLDADVGAVTRAVNGATCARRRAVVSACMQDGVVAACLHACVDGPTVTDGLGSPVRQGSELGAQRLDERGGIVPRDLRAEGG